MLNFSEFSVYRDPSTSITAPLALYVLLCLFGLLLGLWKVKSLGLLGVEDVELPELAIWAVCNACLLLNPNS